MVYTHLMNSTIMKTHYLSSLLLAAVVVTFSSCRSESPTTTDTAQATLSDLNYDRVYYINESAKNISEDLVLHLSILKSDRADNTPQYFQNGMPLTQAQSSHDPVPTHIGPFTVKKAKHIKNNSWDLEQLILEWIFDAEESLALMN